MGDCSRITLGLVAAACGKQATGGTNPRVILLNYADIDRALSAEADGVISSIVLKEDTLGYEFTSLDNAAVGTATFNKGTYFGNFQHDLALRVFTKSEDAKKFVNSLNGARVVAIVENKEGGAGGAVKYEAYGWDAGLELNEGTGTTEIADGVVYELTIGSGETSKEGTLPKSVFAATLAATETMLAALVTTGA
ncbi:MAG: hypothetical protein LBF55_05650 [Prevotellaceae bacterium]|jgi:hypothetical protein|nr:hypothetical protein [Prevotellaceae bacterium]